MIKNKMWYGLVGAAFLVCRAGAQAEGIAFINATVDPIDGATITGGMIGIKGGVITHLGSRPAPDGYKVVDLKGGWVTAGFIDSAMTRGMKLPEPIPNETRDDSTTVPTSLRPLNRKGVRPELVAAEHLDLKLSLDAAHAAGFASALMVPPSGSFRGQPSLIWLESEESKLPALVPSVGQAMSFLPGVGAGFPSTSFGVIALYRQTMMDAQRYQLTPKDQRPKELESLNSLAAILRGQKPLMWVADNGREVLRAVNLAEEFDARVTIIGGREAWMNIDALLEHKVGVIGTVAVGDEPTQTTDPDAKQPESYLAERKAEWRDDALNLIKLHGAGVPFVISSYGDAAGSFLKNLRGIVKLGLPKNVALRAVTLGPAEMFGVADKLGSLKIGKAAAITVFTGDPMDDKSTVSHVVVNGRVVEVKN